MGGQKFQYDESGGTFFYFLLSFLALLLIPGTFYWWPRESKRNSESSSNECQCDHCKKKKHIMQSNQPWKGTKQFLTKLLIVSGWIILLLLAYKVSQFDYEYANFDPYEILGVPLGSSQSEIKRAYRKLSLLLHPDKETGDEKAFMKLTKAYQALTDDEARRNWEKYGNPDGPGAMSFGIALPSWIVEKENSVWVLGLYALVFMVALPTVVGMWWYKSIRYSGDQVLLETTQMYFYFFHKTPSMVLKRVIMILGASLEFERKHNSEVIERPTDNIEVPQLIKLLPNLSEKNRERPLCFTYSIKARAIIHAHLSRIPLNENSLEKDRHMIIKKCPYLLQEMVSCVSQLILLAYARRVPRLPNIETIENCMKLSPMIVQGLLGTKSPLLQLPHVTEESLKYFTGKKRHIKTVQQFAQLPKSERRNILKHLTDEQFSDVEKVLAQMPLIDFQYKSEVVDDETPNVYTAGAIVTVTVTLVRHNLSTYYENGNEENEIEENLEEIVEKEEEPANKKDEPKKPVWLKQQKKSKKPNAKKFSKGPKPIYAPNVTPKNGKKEEKGENEKSKETNETSNAKKPPMENESGDESDISDNEGDHSDDDSQNEKKGSSVEDDDTEWEKFQSRLSNREKALEGRSKMSHSVHCPFYPEDKQEYWWVYISDRKSRSLLTTPVHVTALINKEEVHLRFTAPRWPGVYTFTINLRSDSYLGFDQSQDMKLDVKEAPEIPTKHPQWDISDEDEEEPKEGNSDISEYTTDEDVEDV